MSEDAAAVERWNQDMQKLRHSQDLMFLNKYDEAEAEMKKGMEAEPAPKGPGYRDTRAVFGMLYALLSASKGIANLSDDQLTQCHERLVKAERLAYEQEDWVGRTCVRGLTLISMGLVELLQHSYVKGIYNIYRSWKYIRVLRDEGLNYQGKEAEIIRSAALMTIGAFYLLYSFLPPTAGAVASWLSGFQGDRNLGLKMMYDCWKEGGLCAPWGALNYISFHVDTKTFIGERMTDEEHANIVTMLNQYKEKYPNSILFCISESGLYACDRDIETARRLNEDAAPHLVLPALKWVMMYKRGIFYWTDCDWFNAGLAYEESMNIYVQAGRRSMVPFMAAYAFLSFLQAMRSQPEHRESAKENCKKMVQIANKYSSMNKKDWGRQDVYGFKVFEAFSDQGSGSLSRKGSTGSLKSATKKIPNMLKMKKPKKEDNSKTPWVLLFLLEAMVLQVRNTWFMTPDSLESLRKKIMVEYEDRKKNGGVTAGEKARMLMCEVEIFTHMDKISDALATANKALALEPELTKKEKSFGAIPMTLYFIAKIQADRGNLVEAKANIKKLKKYGNKHELAGLIYLKLIVLSQQIGVDFEEDYTSINISAGYKKVVTIDLEQHPDLHDADNNPSQGVEEAPEGDKAQGSSSLNVVEWAWFLGKHTVGFRAEFHPKDTSQPPMIIQTTGKAESEGKFIIGEFRPKPEMKGKIHLIWDNSFSKLRGKTVQYKISPAYLKSEVL